MINYKDVSSPRSRAIEAERIARSRFKSVRAVSHSEIILVTEDGSPATVSEEPTATAACESRRFFKFPRNCQRCQDKGITHVYPLENGISVSEGNKLH